MSTEQYPMTPKTWSKVRRNLIGPGLGGFHSPPHPCTGPVMLGLRFNTSERLKAKEPVCTMTVLQLFLRPAGTKPRGEKICEPLQLSRNSRNPHIPIPSLLHIVLQEDMKCFAFSVSYVVLNKPVQNYFPSLKTNPISPKEPNMGEHFGGDEAES